MKKTYVILGGTGHTGKPIAQGLLAAGHNVRIVGRDKSKAADLISQGAEFLQGDQQDAAFLTKAFTGADAVYAMVPPNMQAEDFPSYQRKGADAIATALQEAKVPNVVMLSSVGAHRPDGVGAIGGLHYMEQKFNAIDGLNARYLRAGYFMENLLGFTGMVKHMGILGSAMNADQRFSTVATKDVAARGLKRLLDLDFKGKDHEFVLGPSEHSYSEMTSVLGKHIGKSDLKYVQFPVADAAQGMMGMGMSKSVADNMNGIAEGMNTGRITEGLQRTPENTGKTTFEEFAGTWKAVYDMN